MKKLFIIFLLLAGSVGANTYYVADSTNPNAVASWGDVPSDGHTGLSWAAAWASVNKVNNTLVRGDTVYFGTGTWYNYPISPPQGITTGVEWTVYSCSTHTAAVASQYRSKIRSGNVITNWIQHSGNIYKARWDPQGGYSGSGTSNNCQTMVQVDADKMLCSVGNGSGVGKNNIDAEGEFAYELLEDTVYAWRWGGGDPDQAGDTIYASIWPVVWFERQTYPRGHRRIEFFGLDLQGGKQGVVVFLSFNPLYEIDFIHCHLAKSGHLSSENPACFFSQSSNIWTSYYYDNILIQACSLGYCIMENTTGWANAAGHGGATDFYRVNNGTVESCYVYGISANGICFKVKNGNIKIRYNTIEGNQNLKGIVLYRNYENAEVYGNLLIGDFGSTAMDIGAKKSSGDTYGANNVKIFNNTIINPLKLGVIIGNYDDEPILEFTGDNQFKYNIIYGYSLWEDCTQERADLDESDPNHCWFNNPYACVTIGYHFYDCRTSTFICYDNWEIDYNAYYSSTDNFNGGCNGDEFLTFTEWKNSICSNDDNSSGDIAIGLNLTTYALPDTTSLTMNQTYGGRIWTTYGAMQDLDIDISTSIIDVTNTSLNVVYTLSGTETAAVDSTVAFGSSTDSDPDDANDRLSVSTEIPTDVTPVSGLSPSSDYWARHITYWTQNYQNIAETSAVVHVVTGGAVVTAKSVKYKGGVYKGGHYK